MKALSTKLIKKIEKNTGYRMTAVCSDGSAFFVATRYDGTALGVPALLTPAQIKELATLKDPRR